MKLDHNMIGNGRLDIVLTLSEVSEHFETLNLLQPRSLFAKKGAIFQNRQQKDPVIAMRP